MECLNKEIERFTSDERYITDGDYPVTIKPNFQTLGRIEATEIGRGWQTSSVHDDTLRDLIGFKPTVLHEDYNLSDKLVDIISFDNIFLETDIAQGTIFKDKRAAIFHEYTMDVDPGYKYKENFRGRFQ